MLLYYSEKPDQVYYIIILDCNGYKPFKTKKDFTAFKQTIRKLYIKCHNLYKQLIIQNNKNKEAITPFFYSQGNPIIKSLPEIVGADINPQKTKITKLVKTYLFGNEQQYSLITKNINKQFTISDMKYMFYILGKINPSQKIYSINLMELMNLKKVSDKKEFLKQCEKSLRKFANDCNFSWQTKDSKEKITVFPINAIKINNRNFTHHIIFNDMFYSVLCDIYNNPLAIPINKNIFSIPDNKTETNRIAFELNNHIEFTKGKKHKKINQHQDTAGIYGIISINTVLNKTNFKQTYKKPSKYINALENIFNEIEYYKVISY